VITSFRHKGLERLFAEDDRRGIAPAMAVKLRRMLLALDTATEISDMDLFPGWRLHPLKGDLAGLWSLTVASNWRLIFRFDEGDASEVDLVDYH
jgi:proteic killer suppression protein